MIVPTGYRLLVSPDPVEETSKGGIVIAQDTKREKTGRIFGVIKAVGAQCWSDFDEPWAKVGDHVAYAKYSGKNIKDPVTEEEFVILNDVDIVARVED